MNRFPSNRQLKKLWEVWNIIRWLTYKPDQVRDEQTGIACFRTKNIQLTLDETDIVYIDKSLIKDEEKMLRKGDILISSANSLELLGKCCFITTLNYSATLGGFICCLRANKLVDAMYLYYFFNSENIQRQVRNLANKTTGIANLPLPRMMESIQIPLPPLEEQKKIVAYLDELNATISKLKSEYQSQLAMLDEMRNSSLELAFWGSRERAYNLNNWKWVKFAKVCEKITDGTHQTPTYFDNWFVFLSSKNVTSGKIDWDNIKYIDEKQHIEMQKRIAPKKWDILLAKNWTTGIAAIVDRDIIFDIYVSLALLRPQKNIIDNKYLLYFVNSPSAKQQFNKRIKWVGVPNLHLKEIKDVELPLPDLETQSQIVAHLDQVHQQITMLKTQVNSQIEHCDELWQSSLEKVLTQGVNNEFN